MRSLEKRRTAAQKDQVAEYKAKLSKHAAEKKEEVRAAKQAKKQKRSVGVPTA